MERFPTKTAFCSFHEVHSRNTRFCVSNGNGVLDLFRLENRSGKKPLHQGESPMVILQGWTEERMTEARKRFTESIIPNILFAKAIERIKWHQAEGHRVIVVTASCDAWLGDWTKQMGLEILCTEMELNDGVYTGELSKPNCRGTEKVNRVKQHLNIENYSEIYAYGNDHGDNQLLAMADHPHFREFED